MRLAEKTGCKRSPKIRHLRTIIQLYQAISSQLRHVSTIGKKLVKQQYLPTWPYNMVNFGPLATETGSLVWGTPANFNGFRWQHYCTASSSGRQPNFAALNRERHLYSTGRPSCWALTHILVGNANKWNVWAKFGHHSVKTNNITELHNFSYGQPQFGIFQHNIFCYDSLLKVIKSWRSESYVIWLNKTNNSRPFANCLRQSSRASLSSPASAHAPQSLI